MVPTKADVLSQLDPLYLGEYVAFAGQIREYVNDTLGTAFRADPNPVRRAHHIISLVQLEYAAYEDAAAILRALIAFRTGSSKTVLEILESYKPGEAILSSVLDGAGAETAEKLYTVLRLEDAIPSEWPKWFPALDLRKSLSLACQFLTLDCRANQKPLGVAAYNKSKHGPLIVGNGRLLGPSIARLPSMFFGNRWPAEFGNEPVIVYGFPQADAAITERERCIHFVQRSLRLIVATLLGDIYSEEVRRRWGSVEEMWKARVLLDVVEFISEITTKK